MTKEQETTLENAYTLLFDLTTNHPVAGRNLENAKLWLGAILALRQHFPTEEQKRQATCQALWGPGTYA